MSNAGKPRYGSVDLIASIARSKYPVTTASKYASAMIDLEGTKEVHFPEGAQHLMTCLDLVTALDKSLTADKRNKRTSWGMFTDQNVFNNVLKLMLGSDVQYLRDQANAFLDVGSDDREMRGIKSTLRTQCTRTFSEEALMDTLCSDCTDFSQINDRPISVYIVIPGELAQVQFRYIRLLMTYFLCEIERGGRRRFA